jgi:hypothetical protein
MRRSLTTLPVLAAALFLAAPTDAASASRRGTFTLAFPKTAGFSLRGTNGYRAQVEAVGHRVVLSIGRGPASASYEVRGRVSRQGIEARFGRFGRVDVEFRPSGRVVREGPFGPCRGRPATRRFGVFAGTIRFRGERGYTKISATHARGGIESALKWKCKGGNREPGGREPETDVTTILQASTRHGRLGFAAITLRAPGERGITAFLAGSDEHRGRMRVQRLSFVFSRRRTFTFDELLTSATVKPPKPFDGTGIFRRGPGGSTAWMGDLTVPLPGEGDVALTGRRYKAHLIQPETLTHVPRRPTSSSLGRLPAPLARIIPQASVPVTVKALLRRKLIALVAQHVCGRLLASTTCISWSQVQTDARLNSPGMPGIMCGSGIPKSPVRWVRSC